MKPEPNKQLVIINLLYDLLQSRSFINNFLDSNTIPNIVKITVDEMEQAKITLDDKKLCFRLLKILSEVKEGANSISRSINAFNQIILALN